VCEFGEGGGGLGERGSVRDPGRANAFGAMCVSERESVREKVCVGLGPR